MIIFAITFFGALWKILRCASFYGFVFLKIDAFDTFLSYYS